MTDKISVWDSEIPLDSPSHPLEPNKNKNKLKKKRNSFGFIGFLFFYHSQVKLRWMTYFQKYPISQKYCYLPLHLETPYRNIVWWFEGAGGSLFIYCTRLYFCSLTPMHYFYESNESFPGPTLTIVTVPHPPFPGHACHSPDSTGIAMPLPPPSWTPHPWEPRALSCSFLYPTEGHGSHKPSIYAAGIQWITY